MIDICVPIKNYIREAGVMLCSLYENTAQKVNTYILYEDLDVYELWNTDMDGNAVMGVQDASVGMGMEEYLNGYGDYFTPTVYVNSEVLLMDLHKVREKWEFWKQSICFLNNNLNLMYMDQDAINYVFKNSIGLLDEKYNRLTIYSPDVSEKGIYHFAGDHKLWKADFARGKFFEYLIKTPWNLDSVRILKRWVNNTEKRMEYYKLIIKNTQGRKKCFWGIAGTYFQAIMEYFSVEEEDFFVDSNSEKWGR